MARADILNKRPEEIFDSVTTWDSSNGIQAQTAAIVVVTRDIEAAVKKLDKTSTRMAQLSIVLASLTFVVAALSLLVAVNVIA